MNLEEFSGPQIPQYAILSHCWGIEEVTFQDIQDIGRSRWHLMAGATKIRYAIVESSRHDLNYVWIDTCCIDKSSSAELSEATNSMYSWYEESEICFAYLEDIPSAQSSTTGLGHSRWFIRGWTLQELIAPANINFYGCRPAIPRMGTIFPDPSNAAGLSARIPSEYIKYRSNP